MHLQISKIWEAGVNAVLPGRLIKQFLDRAWFQTESILRVDGYTPFLIDENVNVIGVGKAALEMTGPLAKALGSNVVHGVVSVPMGSLRGVPLTCFGPQFEIYEGAANNLPDTNAFESAKRIKAFAQSLDDRQILILLLSGGGSALLALPSPGITLEDEYQLTTELSKRGATIQEMNCVRRCISEIKGGGLSKLAHPARTIALILSDVIGDPLKFIASGPTVALTPDEYVLALETLNRFLPESLIPASVLDHLKKAIEETPVDVCRNPLNVIIGSNKIALEACACFARMNGINAAVVSTRLFGEVQVVATFLADLARIIVRNEISSKFEFVNMAVPLGVPEENLIHLFSLLKNGTRPFCLIFGGETTVNVNGRGTGGRNQELALRFSKLTVGLPDNSCVLLSGGSDGIDGPTTAAGAFGYPGLWQTALQRGIPAEKMLHENDSNGFYQKFEDGADLLITGHTGTNVMDIMLLMIV